MSENRTPKDHAESRREFLKQLSAASLAALAAGEPRPASLWASRPGAEKESTVAHPRATADSCILLWMAGGMAAPDTFDPKRYVPFKVGTPVKDILSTFPAIDTKVDNIKICQGLGN